MFDLPNLLLLIKIVKRDFLGWAIGGEGMDSEWGGAARPAVAPYLKTGIQNGAKFRKERAKTIAPNLKTGIQNGGGVMIGC